MTKLTKTEKEELRKQFLESEKRIMDKVYKRVGELAKNPKIKIEMLKEIKTEYAKQTLHKRNLQREKAC